MKILLLILLCILVLIIAIINNVTKPLTTSRFIATNYLYIFTGLLIYLFTGEYLEKQNIDIFTIGQRLMPLFILTLLLLFGILMMPSENQSIKHLLWLGFVILISVTGYPIYKIAKEEQILYRVLVTLAIIFIIMSYVQIDNFESYMPYLLFGLIGLIIFQSLDLIFGSSSGINKRFWYYSIFGIFLFSGFLIYDTQKIIKLSKYIEKNCIKTHLECADYPTNSLSIILDLLNLFNQLTYINKKS